MRTKALLLLAVVGLAAAVAVFAWPSSTHASWTITYFEDLKSKHSGFALLQEKIASKKNASGKAGSTVIFHAVLRSRRGGAVIGKNTARCTKSGFGIDFCHGILQLTGRGYLVWDGQTASGGGAHVRTFPVVGGTGEFDGATGYIQSAKQADTGRGIDWTIVLIG